MGKFIDLTGRAFGELTVIAAAGYSSTKVPKRQWLCSCTCGGETTVIGDNLRSGVTSSCGCRMGNLQHGHSVGRYNGGKDSPTLLTYRGMVARCNNPKHSAFDRYGGSGVVVCARWMEGFENFLADMGERPEGCTLDRIDNSKGYSPENCRWATSRQQYENKRVVRSTNGQFTKG